MPKISSAISNPKSEILTETNPYIKSVEQNNGVMEMVEPVYPDKQLNYSSTEDRQIDTTAARSTGHDPNPSQRSAGISFWHRFLLVQGIGCVSGLGLLSGSIVWAKNQTSSDAFVIAQIPDIMPKAVSADPAPEPPRQAAPVNRRRSRAGATPRSRVGGRARSSQSIGGNSYIDPTDYSLGATRRRESTARAYSPPSSVVLSERSTGCQTVYGNRGVAGSRCGGPAASVRTSVRRTAVASNRYTTVRRQRIRDIPRSYQTDRVGYESERPSRSYRQNRVARVEQTQRSSRSYRQSRVARVEQTQRSSRSYSQNRVARIDRTERSSRSYETSRVTRSPRSERLARSYRQSRVARATQTDRSPRSSQLRVARATQTNPSPRPRSYYLSRLPRPIETEPQQRSQRINRLRSTPQREEQPRQYRISRLRSAPQNEEQPRQYRISRLRSTPQNEEQPRSYQISRLPSIAQNEEQPRQNRISRLRLTPQNEEQPRSYRISRLPSAQQNEEQSLYKFSRSQRSSQKDRLSSSSRKKRQPQHDRTAWKPKPQEVTPPTIGHINISPAKIDSGNVALGRQNSFSNPPNTSRQNQIDTEITGNETLPNPTLSYNYKQPQTSPAESGNSKLPIAFPLAVPAQITSVFGWRINPISGDRRFHTGTDLGAPMGTPVLAAHAGRVAIADFLGGYGLSIIVRHKNDTQETRYGHLSEILVKPGEWVQQGSAIGLVGSTGNSTGPHLHFEVREKTPEGWIAMDPRAQLEYGLAQLVKALKPNQLTEEIKPEQTENQVPEPPQAYSQPPQSGIPNSPPQLPPSGNELTDSQLPEVPIPNTPPSLMPLPEQQSNDTELPESGIRNVPSPEVPLSSAQPINSQLPPIRVLNTPTDEVPRSISQPINSQLSRIPVDNTLPYEAPRSISQPINSQLSRIPVLQTPTEEVPLSSARPINLPLPRIPVLQTLTEEVPLSSARPINLPLPRIPVLQTLIEEVPLSSTRPINSQLPPIPVLNTPTEEVPLSSAKPINSQFPGIPVLKTPPYEASLSRTVQTNDRLTSAQQVNFRPPELPIWVTQESAYRLPEVPILPHKP
ncbi:M23 family metallopeptidase [Planktothrix sp. FACHB-1355]|uniref:M23 family metallopeptidase n=1 Tax=Planktothrix sp. FACHB-1355 TaxID=2692854 RepID=UPI001F5495C2|nr:M23 family metallopeptidase [Planktothrix sp. FACHB-1355]